jgi:hypothetical protein
LNSISDKDAVIEELQKFTLAPSSCLSCQVGITQHINRKDLLKVESLGNEFNFFILPLIVPI